MDKAIIIQQVCSLLLSGKRSEGEAFVSQHYPFASQSISKRQYTRLQACRVFLADGFIDRYSGDRLLFPGLIRLLSFEFPDIFPFHPNWKMSDTHLIYWELFPTIDHVVPVARGGADAVENMVTTSMLRNAAKSNWLLAELGWQLFPKGNLHEWDGLVQMFLQLCKTNTQYTKHAYINSWHRAIVKALDSVQE